MNEIPLLQGFSCVRIISEVVFQHITQALFDRTDIGEGESINAGQPFSQNVITQSVIDPDSKIVSRLGSQVKMLFQKW
jgi:hypothetical protein